MLETLFPLECSKDNILGTPREGSKELSVRAQIHFLPKGIEGHSRPLVSGAVAGTRAAMKEI